MLYRGQVEISLSQRRVRAGHVRAIPQKGERSESPHWPGGTLTLPVRRSGAIAPYARHARPTHNILIFMRNNSAVALESAVSARTGIFFNEISL